MLCDHMVGNHSFRSVCLSVCMAICPFICLSFRLPVFLHVCQETLPVMLDQHQAQCSYLVCIFLGSSVLDDIRVYHLVTLTLTQ